MKISDEVIPSRPSLIGLMVRLALFSLPGVLAWMVIQPNLRQDYLSAAAWVCVGLSAASIALAAVVGAVWPVPKESGRRYRASEAPHQNGASS
ncbi:MAG TPA: hypothetical protein VFT74_04635 [Isosphaeraceae bacterium]|nr:hypothetical protein [Isosphaeraceae bacterium]